MARVKLQSPPAAPAGSGDDLSELLAGFDLEGLGDLPDVPLADELSALVGDDDDEDPRVTRRYGFDPKDPAFAKFRIGGNTFDVKDQLKQIGCRWSGQHWVAPNEAVYKQGCSIRDKQKAAAPPKQRCGTFAIQTQAPYAPPPPQQGTGNHGRRKRANAPPIVIIDEGEEIAAELGVHDDVSVPTFVVAKAMKVATDEQLVEELRLRGRHRVEAISAEELAAEQEALIKSADAIFEENER